MNVSKIMIIHSKCDAKIGDNMDWLELKVSNTRINFAVEHACKIPILKLTKHSKLHTESDQTGGYSRFELFLC